MNSPNKWILKRPGPRGEHLGAVLLPNGNLDANYILRLERALNVKIKLVDRRSKHAKRIAVTPKRGVRRVLFK